MLPTVYMDFRAIDIRSAVRAEEMHKCGDFLGLTHAFHWNRSLNYQLGAGR
ncbi:hypothetical protein D3C75_1318520 [compost metagenome]